VAKAFGGLGVTAGLAADRTSMSGMSAGQQFFETDTGIMYLYNGSSWNIFMPNFFNIVEGNSTTSASTSSTAYQATNLTATINKIYSISKIIVNANAVIGGWNGNATQDAYTAVRLIETNSGRVKDFNRVWRGYNVSNSIANVSRMPFQWLDAVSGTGSRTYRLDYRCVEGAPDTSEFNLYSNGLCLSDIFLQEVF
jgi:hypothetical protein